MREDDNEAEGAPNVEAFRELVMSARVYYRNDKRVDWAEWQHLMNEAREHGLTDEDALRAAREAIGSDKWSPPLPPPAESRSGSDANSLNAISLNTATDGEVNVSRLKPGIVINGTYRLEEEIGSGGMGVVWRAVHTNLGTMAAIKFLKRAMDEESAARFMREARMAAKLQSPHLARVFDCAQLETGELFIVMEYFQGVGLDAYLRREGPLPVRLAVDYILQACAGLAAAHKQDIVHRDIKPANLFLAERDDGEPTVKIVDFGLSRLAQAEDGEGLTRDQILLGTPEYAPPEQFGNAMNARIPADVWSIGATLYCLLSGLPPFPKDQKMSGLYQMSDLLKRVTTAGPKPLHDDHEEIPPELDKVILKCLEKRPEDRYPSVADLALDLVHFGSEEAPSLADEVVTILTGGRPSKVSDPDGPQSGPRVSVLSDEDIASSGARRLEEREEAPPKKASEGGATPLLLMGVAVVIALGVIVYWVAQ
jgi:eukaryotic-like serine/threonine-protein kinase